LGKNGCGIERNGKNGEGMGKMGKEWHFFKDWEGMGIFFLKKRKE